MEGEGLAVEASETRQTPRGTAVGKSLAWESWVLVPDRSVNLSILVYLIPAALHYKLTGIQVNISLFCLIMSPLQREVNSQVTDSLSISPRLRAKLW